MAPGHRAILASRPQFSGSPEFMHLRQPRPRPAGLPDLASSLCHWIEKSLDSAQALMRIGLGTDTGTGRGGACGRSQPAANHARGTQNWLQPQSRQM